MGTSLGANAALEVASQHPERLRGLVIEMPVLDNGLLGERARLHAAARGADLRRAGDEAGGARVTRAVPRGLLPALGQRDARRDPPGTGARAARCCRASSSGAWRRPAASGGPSRCRRSCSATRATPCTPSPTPACSPREMPNARLIEANSLVELRLQPGAPDRRDRGLPGRALGAARGPNGPRARSATTRERARIGVSRNARTTRAEEPREPARGRAADGRRRSRRSSALGRGEHFDFADLHVAGRGGRPDGRRGGLADPQHARSGSPPSACAA